jgi:hypothetical protein
VLFEREVNYLSAHITLESFQTKNFEQETDLSNNNLLFKYKASLLRGCTLVFIHFSARRHQRKRVAIQFPCAKTRKAGARISRRQLKRHSQSAKSVLYNFPSFCRLSLLLSGVGQAENDAAWKKRDSRASRI